MSTPTTFKCPLCPSVYRFLDQMQRDMIKDHAPAEPLTILDLEALPMYSIVVDGTGQVWQKLQPGEDCWVYAGAGDIPRSSWWLVNQGVAHLMVLR